MKGISEFNHETGENLPIYFLHYLAESGYDVQIQDDYWQFRCEHRESGHDIAVRVAEDVPVKRDLMRMYEESATTHVILADFDVSAMGALDMWVAAAKGRGIGVYSRQLGWLNLPHMTQPTAYHALIPLLNPLYTQTPEGFLKTCKKCGEMLPLTEFYRRPRSQKTARDPYRNQCKVCFRGRGA